MPVHIVIKHNNKGKIESHKWFFKGFCDYMKPKYCQIIDCGSIPDQFSTSKIIRYLDNHSKVGGATGEIEVYVTDKKDDGTAFSTFERMLLLTQYVEYKLANVIDKAMESLFGFLSVLPGAFSIFRYEAIEGRPIDEFLKGAKDDFTKIENMRS